LKRQLASNRWSSDMATLMDRHDRLAAPDKCRADPHCPRRTHDDGRTVCPFGFWGFLHQIEQPLQHVEPTPVDQVPKELQSESFEQTSFLVCSPKEHVKIAIAACPRIPNCREHAEQIRGLGQLVQAEVVYEEDRNRVLELLKRGGWHLYYFYCHGEMQGLSFALQLGPADRPAYLSAPSLNPQWQEAWPDEPHPLFVVNACESNAQTPEQIHGFLGKLSLLGASGVVGSEIKVSSDLAQPFGVQLIKGFLKGQSLGEVFLDTRQQLLRQCNPLGLAYSHYSPATLHLHDPDHCAWCRAHPPTRVPGG
jgi:hypothetical protein